MLNFKLLRIRGGGKVLASKMDIYCHALTVFKLVALVEGNDTKKNEKNVSCTKYPSIFRTLDFILN